jgi:ABC-type antimicrobial peptide transport system permease subunit
MDTLRIATGALTAHKLRSFLTLLGVIIGVMTVISVVSILAGLNDYIAEKVFTLARMSTLSRTSASSPAASNSWRR